MDHNSASLFVGKSTKIVPLLLNFMSVDEILGFLLTLDEMNHPNGDQGNHVDLMDKIIEPELLDKIKEVRNKESSVELLESCDTISREVPLFCQNDFPPLSKVSKDRLEINVNSSPLKDSLNLENHVQKEGINPLEVFVVDPGDSENFGNVIY